MKNLFKIAGAVLMSVLLLSASSSFVPQKNLANIWTGVNTFTQGIITPSITTGGKTGIFSNSLTLAGTDGTTMTFPTTNATIARTDTAQTFAGTQTFSGAITPSQTIGIVGTTTNNSAQAGSVGELLSGTIATGSSVSLSTGTTANVTSVALTAGDWDCSGVVDYTLAATTSVTNLISGISSTTGTLGAQDTFTDFETAANVMTATNDPAFATPTVRMLLSGNTTVFLVSQAKFTVSTAKAYGTIRCRRVR